ncbi:MAG: hypothetical protein ABW045_05485 [Gaiellaceae bacterium]
MEWETVIAALVVGSAAALLTTVLHISYERGEKVRERKIEAADEFVATTLHALLRLRDAVQAAKREGERLEGSRLRVRDPDTAELLPDVQAAIERARELGDEAYARLARV